MDVLVYSAFVILVVCVVGVLVILWLFTRNHR